MERRFEAAFPGMTAYSNSQSMGTMSSTLVMLEYLERAYGPTAIPDVLVVGLITRSVANIGNNWSPTFAVIDEYSPHFSVDREALRLRPKGPIEGLAARLRFMTRQGLRYRNALRVVQQLGAGALLEDSSPPPRARVPYVSARYHHLRHHTAELIQVRLEPEQSSFRQVSRWDFAAGEENTRRELGELYEFARRNEIDLFVVLMPERSEVRALYEGGVYETFEALVRDGLGDTPVLNLRTFLADEEFYDVCHPDRVGSTKVSDRVTAFMQASDPGSLR